MSFLKHLLLDDKPAGALSVLNSAQFNDDGQSLTRTYTSGATWTLSVWVKLAEIGQVMKLLGDEVKFNADNTLTAEGLTTTEVFKDTAEWYHICVGTDLWVNGVSLGAVTTTVITDSSIGVTFSGYLAEYYFIDGLSKTPSDFAEEDSATGQWVPLTYSGAYGSVGFYLDFKDNTNLGNDVSGNASDFTNTTTLVLQTTDTPTNNQCIINFNDKSTASVSFKEAGKRMDVTAASSHHALCTMPLPLTGKYYWEIENIQTSTSGIVIQSGVMEIGLPANLNIASLISTFVGVAMYCVNNFRVNEDGTQIFVNAGQKPLATDIIQIAVDCDNNKMWFGRNDTWFDDINGTTGNPATGFRPVSTKVVRGTHAPSIGAHAAEQVMRFNEDEWTMTVPSGFTSLSSANLPTPDILLPEAHFKPILFDDGNGAKTIGFQPDLSWLKARDSAVTTVISNSVVGSQKYLKTDDNSAEISDAQSLVSFDANGITVGTEALFSDQTGTGMVAWNWKMGGTASTNTAGTLDSEVSAGVTPGCSVLTFTGNGTAGATIGHGLGEVPSFILVKASSLNNWRVYHKDSDNAASTPAPEDFHLVIESTASVVNDLTAWNDTVPSTTLITLGASDETNKDTVSMRAFVFTDIEGFSKFGGYKGNGVINGSFVLTGFRPAWLMIKRIGVGNWMIFDNLRLENNPNNNVIFADDTLVEASTDYLDLLSNGFKIRSTDADVNATTFYIYAAFAESPFQNSRAR